MSDAGSLTEIAREDARQSGLRYIGDDRPGITRVRLGDGFAYVDAGGATIDDEAVLLRIKRLAVPPAWTKVWISPAANGHLQATGRDARGRKQYRYHAEFRAARDRTKYEHTLEFGKHIKKIRERVAADMTRTGLPREKVLATIVHLLDTTLIRVGNDEYARTNGSFGLTTLRNKHVAVEGGALHFEFKGKSGKLWHLDVRDRRVARIVKSCQELPGQHLFQYLDEDGKRQSVGSADVNAYLAEITGAEVTAKDFRTFAGTVLAASALLKFKAAESVTEAKVNVRAAIEEVATRLGNTPAVCRACYVHPEIMSAYLAGSLTLRVVTTGATKKERSLTAEEGAVLRFLRGRVHHGRRKSGRGRRTVAATQQALAA